MERMPGAPKLSRFLWSFTVESSKRGREDETRKYTTENYSEIRISQSYRDSKFTPSRPGFLEII